MIRPESGCGLCFGLPWTFYTHNHHFSSRAKFLLEGQKMNVIVYVQVLWVSNDGLPDLGGVPEEEPSFADEVHLELTDYLCILKWM